MDVDTARCTTCAIYTPTSDVLFGPDGAPYCVLCGLSPPEEWVELKRPPLDRAARVTAGVMLLVPLASFLAACASQL